ncbi:hypothetical protein ANI_1_1346144 [Paecilomyces variotii No. 5]|uniref:Major facilitator superfamily (MFS) profile domain-containing protein n=1 Tax=Byssochlamys spectabilis (strain No. 5 / NBRC 109023) TaxID=1356009 RepID=V5GB02_BYSSN|nr:hypothetical protein ANI_1_1346144 [Paecilomyces variotii No. 5]
MGVLQDITHFPKELARSLRMNRVQALVFATSWWCWTLGSMQFYLLPYTQVKVAEALNIENAKVAEANTTSMLSRSIGAAIFGIISDQYGRKIPLVVVLILMGVFTLCSGFVRTYGQLIGVRLLFGERNCQTLSLEHQVIKVLLGITYGAIYGVNMAAVLEAVPKEARGVVGGFTQQGFGAGNLIASGLNLGLSDHGWRSMYYVGAGLTISAVILRLLCPDYSVVTEATDARNAEEDVYQQEHGHIAVRASLPFWRKFRYAITHHWPIFIYALVLTACFNTLGHGHMDVYPSFLESQRGLSVQHETLVTMILQVGGILGGIIGGYLARYSTKWVPFGFVITMGPLLPGLILPNSWKSLTVGAFFFEFCYGAAIGTVGNILQMVCPHPGIRGAFGGVTYNLGNAISSIAPTIETKMGDDLLTKEGTPDYGRIILILAGIVIGLLALTIGCMPTANVNEDWDHEDPNKETPTHVAPGKEHVSPHTGSVVDIEQSMSTKQDGHGNTEHIEMGRASGDSRRV